MWIVKPIVLNLKYQNGDRILIQCVIDLRETLLLQLIIKNCKI